MHTILIPPGGSVDYSYNLPFPSAQSYVWLGFVRQDQTNVNFSILDRNSNEMLYQSTKKAEYLAKLYFYKKERLKFTFSNPSDSQVHRYSKIKRYFHSYSIKTWLLEIIRQTRNSLLITRNRNYWFPISVCSAGRTWTKRRPRGRTSMTWSTGWTNFIKSAWK